MKALTPTRLSNIITTTESNFEGTTANYIPELAHVPEEMTAAAVHIIGKDPVIASNMPVSPITLQSASKLIPLIGLLEEFGADTVFSWVRMEPSGDDFASIARLDQFGPKPSNPMLNAGAITLCSRIPGEGEARLAWLNRWVETLFSTKLTINNLVLSSERRTGDRNRSLAYLLKSQGNLPRSVEEVLDLYFTLCSYEATPEQLVRLPYLLANGGKDAQGQLVISQNTVKYTLAIMATCGLYNESGEHMVRTGLPAKSGVSGYILAVSPGKAGIVVLSPRVNAKGNSIRGSLLLEALSNEMGWHFGLPNSA